MRTRNLATSLTLLVAATLLASTGALKVSIKEYDVPTPNARPHDPAVSPDGALWVTEQMANKLGRLDPSTGQFREYPLKTPDSGPHGLAADKDGNIWFAAIFKSYIGKLDPKTGNITEYRMPDPRAKDPHTPVFDQTGILWFTLQESSMVGRLDPSTGDIKVKLRPRSMLCLTELS
jgi:virginiamycin B lyase